MSEETEDSAQQTPPSARESGNRLFGLCSYALGVVLVGVLVFLLFEDGIRGIQKDLGSFAVLVVMVLVCFGIGYTTSQKSSKHDVLMRASVPVFLLAAIDGGGTNLRLKQAVKTFP